jgi:hypothetical protein
MQLDRKAKDSFNHVQPLGRRVVSCLLHDEVVASHPYMQKLKITPGAREHRSHSRACEGAKLDARTL